MWRIRSQCVVRGGWRVVCGEYAVDVLYTGGWRVVCGFFSALVDHVYHACIDFLTPNTKHRAYLLIEGVNWV